MLITASHRKREQQQHRPLGPVLLLGHPDQCAALRLALSEHHVTSTADPRELLTPNDDDALVIVATRFPPTSRSGFRRWREHVAQQAREAHLTDVVVDAAGEVPGFAVLLLCDTTGSTSSAGAIRATRQLGRRMAYECALNGAPISSTTYLVIDDATPATTAINAAVTWYFTHQSPAVADRPY